MNFKKVVAQLDNALDQGIWRAGENFSLADASAAPYMVRAEALKLSELWEGNANIANWLKRAIDRTNTHALEQPWGSSSFHKMVDAHANAALPEIRKLTAEVDCT